MSPRRPRPTTSCRKITRIRWLSSAGSGAAPAAALPAGSWARLDPRPAGDGVGGDPDGRARPPAKLRVDVAQPLAKCVAWLQPVSTEDQRRSSSASASAATGPQLQLGSAPWLPAGRKAVTTSRCMMALLGSTRSRLPSGPAACVPQCIASQPGGEKGRGRDATATAASTVQPRFDMRAVGRCNGDRKCCRHFTSVESTRRP